MREMKDSGIEYIGQIPKTWGIHPLYCYFGERKNRNYALQENNLLSLSYGNIIRKDIDAVGGLLPTSFNTYNIVEKDDVIIRPTDLQNDKRSLRTGLVKERGIITSAYIDLKPLSGVNSAYYHYLLHALDVIKVFYNMGNGVRQGLNFDEFSKLMVFCPTADEQEKIVSFLDAKCSEIDALSADIQSEIETLQAYKCSTITEAVTKGLDKNVPMKDSGVEYIGITPTAWKIKRLKYVLKERNYRSETGKEVLLSVSQYLGVVPSDTIQRTMQANSLVGYKKVFINDLVFNKLNPVLARFGVSSYTGITSPDFSVYYTDKADTRFLCFLLRTNMYITEYGRVCTGVGDGFSRLYTPMLYNFFVSLPTLDEQKKIADYIQDKCMEIDSIITQKQEQLEVLADYKKALIYEYVTGKKEVPKV